MGGKSSNQYNPGQKAQSKDAKGNKLDKNDTSLPGQTYNQNNKK